jgi:hypothetical protein
MAPNPHGPDPQMQNLHPENRRVWHAAKSNPPVKSEERFLDYAGRRFRKSEREIKNRPAPFPSAALRASGMTAVAVGAGTRVKEQRGAQRIFTARAARRATMVREIEDWSIMPIFAQRERTAVSLGEKAVLVLKARKR